MQLTPYTTIYDGHIDYRCTVVTDDGRRFDLSGDADTDWAALAERVCVPEPEPVEVVSEVETLRAELEAKTEELAVVAADLTAKTEELAVVTKEKEAAEAIFEEAKIEIVKLGGVVPVPKPIDIEPVEEVLEP